MANDVYGYDVKVIENSPVGFECSICLCILKSPMQAQPCGHRFCKKCIEKQRERNYDKKMICPNDQGEITQIFPDIGIERTILNLLITCTNEQAGCKWTGELRSLDVHKEDCLFEIVSCSNSECDEEMTRNFLSTHVREFCMFQIVSCEYCQTSLAKKMKEDHEKTCLRYTVKCKHQCGREIPREEMQKHHDEECPTKVHPCQLQSIGCNRKGTKHSLKEHMSINMKEHLSMAISKISQQEEELTEQKREIEELKAKTNLIFLDVPMTVKVINITHSTYISWVVPYFMEKYTAENKVNTGWFSLFDKYLAMVSITKKKSGSDYLIFKFSRSAFFEKMRIFKIEIKNKAKQDETFFQALYSNIDDMKTIQIGDDKGIELDLVLPESISKYTVKNTFELLISITKK